MNDFPAYLSLIGTVLLVALFILFIKPVQGKSIKIFLAFSGAYLLGISFTHLLPEVYSSHVAIKAGGIVLIGFLFQLLLDYFSEGIEHAHVHVHDHAKVFPWAMMISLSIHAFTEGFPLERELHAGIYQNNSADSHSLLLGIIFHNIPVTIALAAYFLKSGFKKGSAFVFIAVFSLMGPLGAITAKIGGEQFIKVTAGFFDYSLAFVVGMFMHISTTILFESSEGHRFNTAKLFAIIVGLALAMIAI